jgi:hypothetical protein
MNEYILLMHDDVIDAAIADDGVLWEHYLSGLRTSGQFDGGSSIGPGVLVKRDGTTLPASERVNGYIRVRAESLEAAQRFLAGNPSYEAGGTVEVRVLLRS